MPFKDFTKELSEKRAEVAYFLRSRESYSGKIDLAFMLIAITTFVMVFEPGSVLFL